MKDTVDAKRKFLCSLLFVCTSSNETGKLLTKPISKKGKTGNKGKYKTVSVSKFMTSLDVNLSCDSCLNGISLQNMFTSIWELNYHELRLRIHFLLDSSLKKRWKYEDVSIIKRQHTTII